MCDAKGITNFNNFLHDKLRCYNIIAEKFSRQSARIHWLVQSHMTSNNKTVCRQKTTKILTMKFELL